MILDPLSLAIGSAAKDLPNLAVGGQVILRAAAAFRRVGATLVLVHHTSGDRMRQQAGRGREPLELQDAAYPSIANHVRQWILMNRAEPYDLAGGRRSVLWARIGGSGLQQGGDFRVTIREGHCHELWDVRVESEAQFLEGETARRQMEDIEERRDHWDRVLGFLRAAPRCNFRRHAAGHHPTARHWAKHVGQTSPRPAFPRCNPGRNGRSGS